MEHFFHLCRNRAIYNHKKKPMLFHESKNDIDLQTLQLHFALPNLNLKISGLQPVGVAISYNILVAKKLLFLSISQRKLCQ